MTDSTKQVETFWTSSFCMATLQNKNIKGKMGWSSQVVVIIIANM